MNKFLKYIEENYSIIEFINDIWEWQEYYDKNILNYIMNIPIEYMIDYISYQEIYRGMTIEEGKVSNCEVCSWTTKLEIAEQFATMDSRFEYLYNGHNTLYAVVYKKNATCLLLYKIIEDINNWIKENLDYFLSESMWDMDDDITDLFYNKHEVISDFCIEGVNMSIHSKELLTIQQYQNNQQMEVAS